MKVQGSGWDRETVHALGWEALRRILEERTRGRLGNRLAQAP